MCTLKSQLIRKSRLIVATPPKVLSKNAQLVRTSKSLVNIASQSGTFMRSLQVSLGLCWWTPHVSPVACWRSVQTRFNSNFPRTANRLLSKFGYLLSKQLVGHHVFADQTFSIIKWDNALYCYVVPMRWLIDRSDRVCWTWYKNLAERLRPLP